MNIERNQVGILNHSRSLYRTITGFLMCIGMILTGVFVAPANATELTPGGLAASTATAQQIEQATEDIFTKVIVKDDATGSYTVDSKAQEQYAPDASLDQLKGLALFLTASDQGKRLPETRDWGVYALCVLGGATGFSNLKSVIKNANWAMIGEWIAAHNWKALGSILGKIVTTVGKLTGAKLTVAGIIASVAWSAVTCWGK